MPAVSGDADVSCKWAGPGSNVASENWCHEQLRAGKAGAPAVQHLSVHIKICKAEPSPQPLPPLPLCLASNWCQLFDCDNCYCLGKWLPGPMGHSLVCRQLGLHLPPGHLLNPSFFCALLPETCRSATRGGGEGLLIPPPFPSEGGWSSEEQNLSCSPHQPLLMEEVGPGRPAQLTSSLTFPNT